jgi:hypothetical protein
VYLLSFPISSEVALVTSDHPGFHVPDNLIENVAVINRQTIAKASIFVVGHKTSFPGDECLKEWAKK